MSLEIMHLAFSVLSLTLVIIGICKMNWTIMIIGQLMAVGSLITLFWFFA